MAHWGIVAPCGLWLLLACGAAYGGNTAPATSSRAAREDAVRAIPFDKIEPSLRKRVQQVTSKPSIYRRLPIQVTDSDPEMFDFLVTHPEVVVNIWQTMGISKVSLVRQKDGSYQASDGVGTRGIVRFCHSNHDTHVVYAEGAYEGPLFEKPVRARCVLVFKHGHVRETNGRDYVTSRCDTFIQIEHAGVELLAKTFSPLVTKSADYNFSETAGFLGNLSRTAEANPQGVSRLAKRLTQVDPAVRARFVELSEQLAQKRQATNPRAAAKSSPSAAAANGAAKAPEGSSPSSRRTARLADKRSSAASSKSTPESKTGRSTAERAGEKAAERETTQQLGDAEPTADHDAEPFEIASDAGGADEFAAGEFMDGGVADEASDDGVADDGPRFPAPGIAVDPLPLDEGILDGDSDSVEADGDDTGAEG